MKSKKDEGLVDAARRQHVLSWTGAAVGMGGWSANPAWAAQRSVSKPSIGIPKPEKRSLTLAIANPSALPYLPLLVALHKGFFAQKGLELAISEQQSATRAISAVSTGQADMVGGWLENMLGAQSRALSLQSFVLLGAAPMMALGVPRPILTNTDARAAASPQQPALSGVSAVARLAQLRGRKIGVVALNSPTHTVALATLRRAGLRAADVGFVSVGSPASATAALRSGQIDALVHMDPLMLQLEQRGEITLWADLRSPEAAHEVLGMHLPSVCVAAPQEFAQRYPITAQACSDALVQALQWLQLASLRDVLQLQQAWPDTSPSMDAQSFVASFERLRSAYSPDGVCSPQMASNLLQAMHEAEPALRLEKIDPLKSINNTLAQRSLARLKSSV